MHGNHFSSLAELATNLTSIRLRHLALGLAFSLLLTGCASFSDHMDAFPSRTGAPPYPDDPEANGNPAKAWYN
jgi:hypothetical protein